MNGTITLANGTTKRAARWADGTVTWEQLKMIRHGSGTTTGGFVQRKATVKQARTFILDSWIVDVNEAWDAAHHESWHRTYTEIVAAEAAALVMAPVANLRPWIASNAEFMAYNALTASARRYWARRAGLVMAA